MNFFQVIETEQKIRLDGMDGAFKIELPALVSVKGEPDLLMQIIKATPEHGQTDFFYNTEVKKSQIVLHFTEGHLRGDLTQLSKQGNKVSVPFVVARDGGIYRLFGSQFWAFHIGRAVVTSTNEELSRNSIGIELSNYGPLRVKDNDLITSYGDVYCSLDDTSQYIKLPTKYRDYQYYASFTDAQYEATIVLLRYLTAQYGIPRAFLPEATRYLATAQGATFKGIVSHVNSRADKVDIGPAFDWARVIAGVTAPSFSSSLATRGGVGTRGLGDEPAEPVTERSLDGNMFYRKRKRDFKPGDVEPDC